MWSSLGQNIQQEGLFPGFMTTLIARQLITQV